MKEENENIISKSKYKNFYLKMKLFL
jgi:hypothetical protein